MISTAAMVQCGKAYQNLMVDVKQTNEKLCVRAQRIVKEATGATDDEVVEALSAADGSCKTAIVMILVGCDKQVAQMLLDTSDGHVRGAIEKGKNYD